MAGEAAGALCWVDVGHHNHLSMECEREGGRPKELFWEGSMRPDEELKDWRIGFPLALLKRRPSWLECIKSYKKGM